MKFFPLSPPKNFYLLRFEQDRPVWELPASTGLNRVEPPSPKSRLPILAVIPDRYFFYYLPGPLRGTRRSHQYQAVQMQLNHLFPSPGPEERTRVVDTGPEVLAAFSGPKLQSFLQQHRDLMSRANTVTTPFLLARALMLASNTPSWLMHNPGDPYLLVTENSLHTIYGDEKELHQRIQILGCENALIHLDLPQLIVRLSQTALPWTRFRVGLSELEPASPHTKALFKAAAALLMVGLLFCSGELLKLRSVQKDTQQWTQALDSLYTQALGPDYGADPYGMLLYRAQQSQNRHSRGVDVLDLLGRLSRKAPQGFWIQDLSLGIDSGTVQAGLQNYEQMETFLQDLQTIEGYDFTLDQADSAEGKVEFTLKVRMQGPS